MWACWATWAFAAPAQTGPQRLLDDLDAQWSADRGTSPDGGRALLLTADRPASSGVTVVVTHKSTQILAFADDLWPQRLTALADVPLDGDAVSAEQVLPVARWGAVALDTSGLCGRSVGFAIGVEPVLPSFGPDAPRVYVGAVRGAGEVCPQFRDADEDGRCAQGLDLDGDGWCVGPDEPLPADAAPVDCNDTSPGPRCLRLESEARGTGLALTAEGAAPGDEIWFFGSSDRGQTCPPALGGVCMDLALPRRVASARADDQGLATVIVPRGATTWYQAAVLRLGQDTDVSAATQANGPTVEPDPIQDR